MKRFALVAVLFADIALGQQLTVSGLSPSSWTAGGVGFTLTVRGTGYDNQAVVVWSRPLVDEVPTPLATTFISPTELWAAVPSSLVSVQEIVQVEVREPCSPNALACFPSFSNAVNFVINPPPVITTTSLPTGTVGTLYSVNLAASPGTPPYTWSVVGGTLPTGLKLSSGTLLGTPTAQGQYTFRVTVTDFAKVTSQPSSFTVIINPPPLTIITASPLPPGNVGVFYSRQLSASGGTQPYIWSVAGGSLPPGLTFGSTGVLSGTPLNVGTFNFTARVTDSVQGTATKAFEIVINPALLAITTTSPLPTGTVGQTYFQVLRATGGTQPYIWSVDDTLPGGLTLDSGGVLSGTPTTAGTFNFAIRVTDSAEATVSRSFTLVINLPPLTINTPSPLTNGTVGVQYLRLLDASGGTPPYVWSLASGTLPDGLSFDAQGAIRGTPTRAGHFQFVVQVTDSQQATTRKTFDLTISPSQLAITTTSPLPNGAVGSAYSTTFAATGGAPGYTWSLAEGSLPGGLTLNSSGLLSGTPTATGAFTFTVRVTDSVEVSATKAFALTIDPPALSITTASPLPAGTVGSSYSQTFSATGGVPAYTWSVADGSPPGGLTLNSSGVLSGTPTAAGTSNFTVRVTDTAQGSATKTFAITISTAALTITTAALLPGGAVGTTYTTSLAATGGVPPYSWSVIDGALPGGLALSAAGAISGTPTAGGPFGFTVLVTDSAEMTTARHFDLVVSLAPVPAATISGLSDVTNPREQPRVGVTLASAYPVPLAGNLTLSFAPDAEVPLDDPAVQFASGGRSASFTLNAGQTQAPEIPIQTGSIAGTITVTLRLTAGGADVTPSPAPTRVTRVMRLPPSIASVQVTRTSSGFTVLVTGISTPRQVTQATFRFSAAAGANLQTTEVTVPVTDAFTTWYRSDASAPFGSAFLYTQPFTVQGDTAAVTSVTVTLTNSQGTSPPSSASF